MRGEALCSEVCKKGMQGGCDVAGADVFLALHGVGHVACSNQTAPDSRMQLVSTKSPVAGISFSGHTK